MPAPESHDNLAAVWPPAITLSSSIPPDHRPRKTARLAKASLWAAGAGVACYGGIIAALLTLAAMSRINADMYDQVHFLNVFIHAFYAVGLACNVSAIGPGLLSRGMRAGRTGLALSLGDLCLMGVWTLWSHHENNGWVWSTTVGDDGSCGC